MIHFERQITRRGFLRSGVALGALALPTRVQAAGATPGAALPRRARGVIVLLLEGGMSQFETWDPKPLAPVEYRGSFGQIQTTNPELTIGEHTPLLARHAQLYNVVRSVYMDNARRDHSPGLHWVLTGYDNQAVGVELSKENSYSSVGTVIAHEIGSVTRAGLPNFVAIPNRTQLGGRVNFNKALHLGAACEAFDAGMIPGSAHDTYMIPAGLAIPQGMDLDRLQDRRALLSVFDRLRRQHDAQASGESLGAYQAHAFDLLLGQGSREAFNLNAEPRAIRELYGHSTMGQGTLLARRLIEAGVGYVLVNYSKDNSWDTHGDNFNRLKNELLPPMDQAVSALLVDLDQRGLLDEVLVLVTGEMGRTPAINRNAGRDHWPDVFSLLVAGGGLTRGQVVGSSTDNGERPASRPTHFQEILATIYRQLGIDPNLVISDAQGRPFRILPPASPVRELIRA
jgi:hypothetical protein